MTFHISTFFCLFLFFVLLLAAAGAGGGFFLVRAACSTFLGEFSFNLSYPFVEALSTVKVSRFPNFNTGCLIKYGNESFIVKEQIQQTSE